MHSNWPEKQMTFEYLARVGGFTMRVSKLYSNSIKTAESRTL